MPNTPEKTFKRGDSVLLVAVPTGFVDDLPIEDQLAITEAVGTPVVFNEYDDIGRAELQFTSRDEHLHFIWVDPKFIRPVK